MALETCEHSGIQWESKPKNEWETVGLYTQRFPVEGGWLYRHIGKVNDTMCFVPEVKK